MPSQVVGDLEGVTIEVRSEAILIECQQLTCLGTRLLQGVETVCIAVADLFRLHHMPAPALRDTTSEAGAAFCRKSGATPGCRKSAAPGV